MTFPIHYDVEEVVRLKLKAQNPELSIELPNKSRSLSFQSKQEMRLLEGDVFRGLENFSFIVEEREVYGRSLIHVRKFLDRLDEDKTEQSSLVGFLTVVDYTEYREGVWVREQDQETFKQLGTIIIYSGKYIINNIMSIRPRSFSICLDVIHTEFSDEEYDFRNETEVEKSEKHNWIKYYPIVRAEFILPM